MTNETGGLDAQLGWMLVRAGELEADGRTSEALQFLQEFADHNAVGENRDRVLNAVHFQQGTILHSAGDLAGALQKHRNVHASPADRAYYLLNSFCIARILDEINQPEEALRELYSGLETVGGSPQETDVASLLLYADLAERLHHDLPDSVLQLALNVAQMCGVRLDDNEQRDYSKVIRALASIQDRRLNTRMQ